jgi:hypothetical protein
MANKWEGDLTFLAMVQCVHNLARGNKPKYIFPASASTDIKALVYFVGETDKEGALQRRQCWWRFAHVTDHCSEKSRMAE